MEENIANSRREAEFKAQMLRAGADIDSQLASDSITAAWIGAGGTAISSGANIYSAYNKYKKDEGQDLWTNQQQQQPRPQKVVP
jgi:hypothetical protein